MLDDLSIPEFETMMVEVSVDDIFLNQLFDYYHQQLVGNTRVYHQLIAFGLTESVILAGKFGYCDRTLNRNINRSVTNDGAAFRGSMRRLGLIKESGHELLRGCVVEPVFNDKGDVISACGVKLGKRIRRNAPQAIYWYRQDVYTELVQFTLAELGGQHVG